jgi:prevent-host-death family protein
VTAFTSREFNQDASKAKRAASKGPVFITDRGKPSHVLLSIDEYRRLANEGMSILDLLGEHPAGRIDVDFPELKRGVFVRPVELD